MAPPERRTAVCLSDRRPLTGTAESLCRSAIAAALTALHHNDREARAHQHEAEADAPSQVEARERERARFL